MSILVAHIALYSLVILINGKLIVDIVFVGKALKNLNISDRAEDVEIEQSVIESIVLQITLHFIGSISLFLTFNWNYVYYGFVAINTIVVFVKIIFMVIGSNWIIAIEIIAVVHSIVYIHFHRQRDGGQEEREYLLP